MSKVEELLATAEGDERITLITEALDEAVAFVRQDLTAKVSASEDRRDVYAEASREIIRALVDAINDRRY